MESGMAGVADLGLRIANHGFEVTAVLHGFADQFHVFVEFGRVVGLGKNVFQENGVRNANRPQEVHGVAQFAALDVPVAFKPDAPHFDLRSFAHNKSHAHRCRRNRPNFRADGRELVPVFRQELLDHHLRFLDLGGIVLRLRRDSDLVLLKAVENVAL